LKIGVLETGAPPRDLQPRFGRYPAMVERLLADGRHQWTSFNVRADEMPARPEVCEAYVITGSAAGVYDKDPWIARTKAFLQDARGKAALLGICFGHQLMAEAFGGRVERSAKGWGIGLHTYLVRDRRPWMDAATSITAAASHQDQVVEAPPGARVVAASDFTPFGMLAYDDQPALSVQLHPEFDPAYAAALIEARRGSVYPDDIVAPALASLLGPNDRQRLGGWLLAFLAGYEAGR
jgi:GMP synthase-like glutamine amidotransferase